MSSVCLKSCLLYVSLILAVSALFTQLCFLAITTENFRGKTSYTRVFLASTKENIKDFVLASNIGSFPKKK